MTEIMPAFRDVESELVDIFTGMFPGATVDFERHQDFEDELPYVHVLRIGGSSEVHNDYPVVDVDVYYDSDLPDGRPEGRRIAAEIEQWFLARQHPIDSVRVLTTPRPTPWTAKQTSIIRLGATYQAALRR